MWGIEKGDPRDHLEVTRVAYVGTVNVFERRIHLGIKQLERE